MNVATLRDLFLDAANRHTGISDQHFGWISAEFNIVDQIKSTGFEMVITALNPSYNGSVVEFNFQLVVASFPGPPIKGDRTMSASVTTYDSALEMLFNVIEYVSCNNRVEYGITTSDFINIAPSTNNTLFGAMTNVTVQYDRFQDADNLPQAI